MSASVPQRRGGGTLHDGVHWKALDENALTQRAHALGKLVRPGMVLLLSGPMGAGKTTFTRALGHGMGLRRPQRVCSPTFNICVVHEGPVPLMHIDLFRLAPDDGGGTPAPASFEALGLEPLLDRVADEEPDADPNAAVLAIEWAELWATDRENLDALSLKLSRTVPQTRDLEVRATGPTHAALLEQWAAW